MVVVMQRHGNDKKSKWAKLLEILINAVTAGKSGKVTSRMHLTETEEEILRKKKTEKK